MNRQLNPLFASTRLNIPITSPKQLTVTICNVHLACDLNGQWHSRLPQIHWSNVTRNSDYVCFKAEYDDYIYAVAIWSSPVAANRMKNSKAILELRRLAITEDAPKFTATFMLGKMEKWIKRNLKHIELLISYQDQEVHTGTIYKAANWQSTTTNKVWDWSKSRKRAKAQAQSFKTKWERRIKNGKGKELQSMQGKQTDD